MTRKSTAKLAKAPSTHRKVAPVLEVFAEKDMWQIS
jgi:hypothetical protein